MISARHLEGLARELLTETATDPPVDALRLAAQCGLEVRAIGGSEASIDLDRGVLHAPLRARPTRLHGRVAHELGHWLLFRDGLNHHDEDAATYLGGCLLLPRETFLRDMKETDWDLDALQLRHPNVSAQAIVVRMTQVSPATASVWDHGRLHRVYGEHDIEEARRLVDLALELEEPIEVGMVRAWPVIDGRWRRVLVLARAA